MCRPFHCPHKILSAIFGEEVDYSVNDFVIVLSQLVVAKAGLVAFEYDAKARILLRDGAWAQTDGHYCAIVRIIHVRCSSANMDAIFPMRLIIPKSFACDKRTPKYLCQKVKVVSKLHIEPQAANMVNYAAQGELCREIPFLS